MDDNNRQKNVVWLLYDGDCPICSPTANGLLIKQAVGKLQLVNAREPHPLVTSAKQHGLDLNQGIVVVVNQHFYHGAAALHYLALVGTRSTWLNRINVWLFRHRFIAKTLYPGLRLIRNVLLRIKGVKPL